MNAKFLKKIKIDLSTRKARLALRFFTYGVMTLATVVLTTLAVFYALGYRFDQAKGFEQGGLMQFRSAPDSAQVYVNGKKQDFTTPGRANLPSGSYVVEMHKAGYQTWKKAVDLAPGQLLWLNYARLIPTDIKTRDVLALQSVNGSMVSPDHKWILVSGKENEIDLWLVDLDDPERPKADKIAVPDDLFTKRDNKFGQLELVEWDSGSRYVLVKHSYGDETEFVRLDRSEPAKSVNLSRVFGLRVVDAHMAGGNADVVYARTDDVLRKLDIPGNSASGALVSGVEKFDLYGNDSLVYVSKSESQKAVGLYVQDKATVIRTYPADANLKIAYSEYDHHGYLAISMNSETVLLRDPNADNKSSSQFATFDFGAQVNWVKFNNGGRLVAVNNGKDLGVYDIELASFHKSLIGSGEEVASPPKWLDDYYLTTDAGGVLRIFEYDGINGGKITSVTPGQAVSLTQDGKWLFSFAKPEGAAGYILQATKLTAE